MIDDKIVKELAEKVEKYYEHNPIIRGLIQLVPKGIGSALDVFLVETIRGIREKRLRTFFNNLERRKIELTPEDVKNNDFLHAYFCTVHYVLNTKREEKIRLFSSLFSGYCERKQFEQTDEYEEFLSILDDLGYREFEILRLIYRYELENPQPKEGIDYELIEKYWENLLDEIEGSIGISRELIPGFLTRLNRTGLYKTLVGGHLGYESDQGILTASFQRFINALGLSQDAG